MKLNLHIIKEECMDMQPVGNLCSDPWVLSFSFPCIYHPEQVMMQPAYLYLALGRELNQVTPVSDCSVFCVGQPPLAWLNAGCDILYTETLPEQPSSLPLLLEKLTTIFLKYQQWIDRLDDALLQPLPLQRMAVYSENIIQNGIYLQGAGFRVLANHIKHVEAPTDLYREYCQEVQLPPNTVLSSEEINALISDQEYNAAATATVPTIYSGEKFGFRSLFYNIRKNGIPLARVTVDEVLFPLTNRDFALIHILGEAFARGLSQENSQFYSRTEDLDQVLDNLLHHRLLAENRILNVLANYGWSVNDTYICLLLKLQTREDSTSALNPLAMSLAETIKNDCYTILDNRIVFVCNLTQQKKDRRSFIHSLQPHLRDMLLVASISTAFRDFKNLYYYYLQAQLAEQLGHQNKPTNWYYFFEDFCLDSMLQICTKKHIPDIWIPEGLIALMEHDHQKGSTYTQLLRTYLDCERSIVDTITKEHLHRNTFHYRIRRIQEIMNCDLDNPKVRLELQLALRMLDEK